MLARSSLAKTSVLANEDLSNIEFWTKKGAQESTLGKEAGVAEGDRVTTGVLLDHQKIGEGFLRLGYFRQGSLSQSTSLMECHFQSCMCNTAWNVTQESEDEDSEETNFHDLAFGPEEGDCIESDAKTFATPEGCENLTENSFGKIFLHYFEYVQDSKEQPIKCFRLSKQHCKGKGDWWTNIPLMSVQKLVKQQDVNN